jgi:hypothetical protein
MNLFRNSIVLLLACINSLSFAQNTNQVNKRGPADEYSRSSMSYLLLDFENERYASYLRNAINTTRMPSKFDNNNLSKKYVSAPYSRQSTNKSEKIRRKLIAEKYAIDVVKYWWQVKDDGSYSTDLLQKRGYYNATDDDVQEADATKVGRARLGDTGLKLMSNSYVLVLDYNNVTTMKDIYDEKDRKNREKAKKDTSYTFVPVERTHNGFKGKMTAYLYQLNYSDTVQGYFDETFIDEKKLDVNKLDGIFNNVYSPFKLVTTESVSVNGTQLNPGQPLAPSRQKSKDELAVVLVNDGIKSSLARIEKRIAAFRVKAPVTNIRPIRAKIGTKESVTHERRFFVWEYIENKKGNVVAKRKGVIRAWKVKNNRNDELGRTQESSFYQIGGGTIREGMTLQERKDAGFGIGGGYGSAGGIVRADINAGQWANMPVRQLKLYGEVIFGSKEYSGVKTDLFPSEVTPTIKEKDDFSEIKYAIGILKEYPIGRGNSRWGWKMGWTGETITWTEDKDHPNYNEDRSGEQLSAQGFAWGLQFGINLFSHQAHLIGSVNGHHYGNPKYKSGIEGEDEITLDEGYGKLFDGKKNPISFDLSLRISF